MTRPRILIVKCGTTNPAVVAKHGDYDAWFVRTLGAPERFRVVDSFQEQPLPDPASFDGVIVTGSPLSVCEPAPWMKSVAFTLREWSEAGRPVLGVCFGHQLLSFAYGVPIVRNPNGREIGTVSIALTEAGRADPLFAGLHSTFEIQTTHSDIAPTIPAGTTLLAGNAQSTVQALAFGPRARGVQFHPEIDAVTMQAMIAGRAEILKAEGIDPVARAGDVAHTNAGPTILRNFEEQYVKA